MSELTNQISELRARAVVLRQGRWCDGEEDAAQLEQAADTIEGLRDRLQADGEKTCHATQANYEHCKYSVNRGWCDTSRYSELFGTPERAARTLSRAFIACECDNAHCDACPLYDSVADDCYYTRDHDALLEWLRGDAE